jgi:hypothetical protein
METEGSLLCLQESPNCPHPKLDEFILRHPILGLPRGFLPLVFPNKALYTFPFIPQTWQTPRSFHTSWFDYPFSIILLLLPC